MWMTDRKQWTEKVREQQDEAIDEHWEEYKMARRLWKREQRNNSKAMEAAEEERKKRMVQAAEAVEQWQEEFSKL